MNIVNLEVFSNINKIIERDSKATTYKYALLRGVIDIIQDNSPFIIFSSGRVHMPIGLLIEKWILYYYPIIESATYIPQINGEAKLAFELQFLKIVTRYKDLGGFSVFYNDFKNKGLSESIKSDFNLLINKIKNTITKMPMKYIGRSLNDNFYSIFQIETNSINKDTKQVVDFESLINHFGYFSIPEDYFEAFKILGSFINGQDSILFKWAEFSVNASKSSLSIAKVVNEVLRSPITERNVADSKAVYKSILKTEGKVLCVWTGNPITNYDVDHVIPFSVWKNNDLWNLLPSQVSTNKAKRDKIPSSNMIEKNKELIIYYWKLVSAKYPVRFNKEIKIALIGNSHYSDWTSVAIDHLKLRSKYLIAERGYNEWEI